MLLQEELEIKSKEITENARQVKITVRINLEKVEGKLTVRRKTETNKGKVRRKR